MPDEQPEVANRYSTCVQCNRVFLKRAIRAQESGMREEARSAYADMCVDCERLIRAGEVPPGGIGDDDPA